MDRELTILMLQDKPEARNFVFHRFRSDRAFIKNVSEVLGLDYVGGDFRSLLRIEDKLEQLRLEQPFQPRFECMGCGDLIAQARGLRWQKLLRGEPLTVSVDHSGKPAALNWLTDELIMRHWFGPWERNPNVRFVLVSGNNRGDCHVGWKRVDGPGGTLKFVWQPAEGAEFMEQGGELSGDMICDNSEVRFPRVLVFEAGQHEVGHVLGIGHLEDQQDVMFPTARGEFKLLSTNDIREEDTRYPFSHAA